MRVVFFGTPEFAVPSLDALVRARVEVPLVVTRPDRPVGRSAALRPSAVAARAAELGLPTARPERVRDAPELLDALGRARPDAIAVVAYGRILPAEILGLPRWGCVNVHASLLPRHRGAAPVQSAILAGDAETGVATMKMEEGLDTGPIYLERRVTIGAEETAGELSRRLAEIGGALLVETLEGLAAGALTPRPQRGEPTLTRPVRREDGAVDWDLPAGEIARRLRAYTPWPGLFTFLGGDRVKILEAEANDAGSSAGVASDHLSPGDFRLEGQDLVAAAGAGTSLRVRRLQRAGRGPVTGAEFARAVGAPGRFGRARA